MKAVTATSLPRRKSNFLLSISNGAAVFFLLAVPVVAQIGPAAIEWEQTFGGTDDDWGSSVQQTSDGGYVVCGNAGVFDLGTPRTGGSS